MSNNLPLILPLVIRHASVVYQKLDIKQLLKMHAIIFSEIANISIQLHAKILENNF